MSASSYVTPATTTPAVITASGSSATFVKSGKRFDLVCSKCERVLQINFKGQNTAHGLVIAHAARCPGKPALWRKLIKLLSL